MSKNPYTVRLTPAAREFPAAPHEALLTAALNAGLNVPHSCKTGHCGVCRARVLQGQVQPLMAQPLGLSAQEVEQGYILTCQTAAAADVTLEMPLLAAVGDVPIKTLPCRIEKLNALAPDVMQVMLRLPAVERLDFKPGQYIDIFFSDGRRRSFSIASPPHDSELLELHIRRVAGSGFTEQLFSNYREGTLLHIEGPIGQFIYRDSDKAMLMIAGGTGFAPLKAMLRHVIETGIERDIWFYWGARTPVDVYEESWLLQQCERYPRLRFMSVLSAAEIARVSHQRLGWVHEQVLQEHPRLEDFAIYLAGPPALIEAVRRDYPKQGAQELYFDSFDYAPPLP
jgi:CDP-4-dehydro-6-deoxyglucose reductase, E3